MSKDDHYHLVYTDEKKVVDAGESQDLHLPLHLGSPQDQPGDPEAEASRRFRKQRRRAIHFTFISLFAGFYMAFFAARNFLPTLSGTRKPCHGNVHRFAQGMYKNMSTAKPPSYFTLPSGDKIPTVGLGVWRAQQNEVGDAVKTALKAGYRHIDGAWVYGNEREVGNAIKESSTPREEIWITSKLWNSFHAPDDVELALDQTLEQLGTDYIDLYLIHWPVAFKRDAGNELDWDLTENPYPTWKKMEEMVKKGKIRNIGVSNFNIRRLQNLTANPLAIKPAVNQVELSYWNPQPELLKWSKENGILLEAYSPLGSAEKVKESLQIPEVKDVAKELGLTPAQVYISWLIQRGTVVLPKSVTPSRIEENIQVSVLPEDAFEKVEKAAIGHKPLRTADPKWGVDIWN